MFPVSEGGNAVARLVFLWAMVIGAAGLTVWVGVLAAETGHLTSQVLMALLPLVMLISLGLRAIRRKHDG